MKKLLCLLITVIFIFTALPSYAQDGNMEKILLSVKERIPATESFEEFNSRINSFNGRNVYYFEWSSNFKEKYTSLNVTATESGIISPSTVFKFCKLSSLSFSGSFRPLALCILSNSNVPSII